MLSEISKRLVLLEKADPEYSVNPLYIQGLAVLHEYQRRHEEQGYDLAQVEAMFPESIWRAAQEYKVDDSAVNAGSFVMESASKVNNLSVSFVQLAQNRYSVREYSSEPVSQELLDKSV